MLIRAKVAAKGNKYPERKQLGIEQGPSGTNHGLGVNLNNNGQKLSKWSKRVNNSQKGRYGQKQKKRKEKKTVKNGQHQSKTFKNG